MNSPNLYEIFERLRGKLDILSVITQEFGQ